MQKRGAWSFKTGTLVRMRLTQLGRAVEQGEMLCNPLRGRFDPVLLENFILFFFPLTVLVWIRRDVTVRLLQKGQEIGYT